MAEVAGTYAMEVDAPVHGLVPAFRPPQPVGVSSGKSYENIVKVELPWPPQGASRTFALLSGPDD